MTRSIKFTLVLIAYFGYIANVNGQSATSSAGGTAAGTGGTVTYTVGQVAYITSSGSTGSVIQGVQQPWEISILTAIENNESINPEMNVYPNPARGELNLAIRDIDYYKNLRYRLYDMNGFILKDEKIDSELTKINLQNYASKMYVLLILNSNQEVRVFTIIRN